MMSSGLNLLKIIEEMRKFDTQIEAQAIAVFLFVAVHGGKEGVAMQTISDDLDISQSSVSRNAYKLGDINRHKKIGVGLLETFEDPMERRRKLVRLTAKGKRVHSTLLSWVK
ncbi:transcriptional regulator [Pelagibacter phage HTVC019P]|jgi:DNA-binding MarR family transcriptional regulator|uniref:MarR family transcriptional regulator n=1 Tax=Pelagibacter phage HTVC019P TaxID=1283079 RepID=M1I895_9CAUD|nr:transcriptional regulator [Pelagibacter phage HTVC019P]AGE60587.1 MarR family transcriptional regulator [Pelagibacter phage HTVC019P]